MGNQFEISAVSTSEEEANRCITAGINEIKRIEKLLTTYNESSETNLINRNAGTTSVTVSKEIFNEVIIIDDFKKIHHSNNIRFN